MGKILTGLIIGILIGGGAVYFMLPDIKKAAYDSGYETGMKEGVAKGTAEGIAAGKGLVLAEQKHEHDSAIAAEQKQAEKQKAAQKYKKPEPTQNWRVEGGRIAEPLK